MIIVVEGADHSGKTTLSQSIADKFGWPRIHPGGPPKSIHDRNVKMAEQLVRCVKCDIKSIPLPIIYDRVTCISDPVYRFNVLDSVCASFRDTMLKYDMQVIFCRPPEAVMMEATKYHELKSHDTLEQVKLVNEHQKDFIRGYDNLMNDIPRRHYDFTVDELEPLFEEIRRWENGYIRNAG
jgi:thymidylate kinase